MSDPANEPVPAVQMTDVTAGRDVAIRITNFTSPRNLIVILVVTLALIAAYTSLLPNTNLFLWSAATFGLLSLVSAGSAVLTQGSRRSRAAFALLLGGVGGGCMIVDGRLTPRLDRIEPSPGGGEVLSLSGAWRCGAPLVGFGETMQTPTRVTPEQIEVAVPSGFRDGTVQVVCGPRASGRVFFKYAGVLYDVAVFEMIDPMADPMQKILDRMETFPAFPYYSDASDDPTCWPPQAFKDRDKLAQAIESAMKDPSVSREIAQYSARSKSSMKVLSNKPALENPVFETFSNLRLALYDFEGDYGKLGRFVGPHAAAALRPLEIGRERLRESLPNRMVVIRVKNDEPRDVEHFQIDVQIDGAVYDVTLNASNEPAQSLAWTPERFSVELPRLATGYTADIQVWFDRLPVANRSFPGLADIQSEKTEGVRIKNIGIANGHVRRSGNLLEKFAAYHRYNVDPVVGSPTFGERGADKDAQAQE